MEAQVTQVDTTDSTVGVLTDQNQMHDSQLAHENYVLARGDYNLNEKDAFFIRYVSDKSSFLEPFAGGGFGGGQLPFWPESDSAHLQFTTAEWRRILSPTMVNVARVSFSRPGTAAVTTNSTPPLVFFPGTGRQDGTVAISGLSGIGGASQVPFNTTQNRFTEGDDINWTKGRHSLRFGIALSRLQTNTWFPFEVGSSWSFQGLTQFLGAGVTPGSGNSSLSFTPPILPNGTAAYGNRDVRDIELAPYIQDHCCPAIR